LATARTPESAAAARVLADRCATILDDALVRPLLPQIGDRELVLVPTGPLQSVPWGLLASCRSRPFSISPSAQLWCNAAGAAPRSGGVVLVAGPDLAHSVPEVTALARLYPQATVLTGAAATAGELLRLSAGARLLHVAAHGHFRDDNALFSSLDLADGPVTVYDMQSLTDRPDQVVLSSCQSGRNEVLPGDELLGMAAGFLNLGVRTVVSSAVDVDDAVTDSLMQQFHGRIAAGAPIARALADTRADVHPEDTARLAATSAFTCFGAG
jgi:CHAT domain-containing protein